MQKLSNGMNILQGKEGKEFMRKVWVYAPNENYRKDKY